MTRPRRPSERLELARKLAQRGHVKSARALVSRELVQRSTDASSPFVVIEVNRTKKDPRS